LPAALSDLYTNPGGSFDPWTNRGWAGPYVNTEDQDGDGTYDILEDGWGNQYHYLVSTTTTATYKDTIIRLWSNGPNEVDNNRTGDDITVMYNQRERID